MTKLQLKQVELLLEEKSLDCHLQDSEGRTGLMVAAMEGRLGVVKVILRYCCGFLICGHLYGKLEAITVMLNVDCLGKVNVINYLMRHIIDPWWQI